MMIEIKTNVMTIMKMQRNADDTDDEHMDGERGDAEYCDDGGGNDESVHDRDGDDCADVYGDYDGDDDGWAMVSDMT